MKLFRQKLDGAHVCLLSRKRLEKGAGPTRLSLELAAFSFFTSPISRKRYSGVFLSRPVLFFFRTENCHTPGRNEPNSVCWNFGTNTTNPILFLFFFQAKISGRREPDETQPTYSVRYIPVDIQCWVSMLILHPRETVVSSAVTNYEMDKILENTSQTEMQYVRILLSSTR